MSAFPCLPSASISTSTTCTSTTVTFPHAGTDRRLLVAGLRVRVRESGNLAGPPVAVLHGLMGHAREWDSLIDVLAPTFRVLAVDQRGHGETSWADEYTAAAMADDLAGVLAALGIGPVHVVAHSMGAMAAMLAAAERPHLLDRLVVIDIGPRSLGVEGAVEQIAALMTKLAGASYVDPDEAVDEWLRGDPFAQPHLMRHYVEHGLVRRSDGRLVWRFDGLGLRRFVTSGVSEQQLWGAVDRIAAPTLLVRGEHSPLLPRPHAEAVLKRLRHGALVEIRAGAHDLGVQQPVAVAEAALDFLICQ